MNKNQILEGEKKPQISGWMKMSWWKAKKKVVEDVKPRPEQISWWIEIRFSVGKNKSYSYSIFLFSHERATIGRLENSENPWRINLDHSLEYCRSINLISVIG